LSDAISNPDRGWGANYCNWALDTGNWWAMLLLPFIGMLIWLDSDAQERFPQNLYTLF
jgi:hypothetical protein